MLETDFIFTQSWNGNKLCLKKSKNAPSMVTQFEVHAPQASVHMKGRWSEGSNYEIRERLDWDFTRSEQRLELNENMFHCFNEVDTLKELSSWCNSFFNEVYIKDEPSSWHLVSFFKELDTRKWTMLQWPFTMTNKISWIPRGSHLMGEKHLENQDPMPPAHDVQWHYHWMWARDR